MTKLSRLEAVVLGLLAERPAHGYELKARLGPGLPRERLVNDGVLYPLLGRLESRGLATVAARRSGGRSRRVYSVTGAGDAAFREWLVGDRDEGTAVGYELFVEHPLTKLLFASWMSPAELEAKIDSLLAAARARVAALDAVPRIGEDAAGERIGGALLAVGRAREVALVDELERLRGDGGVAPDMIGGQMPSCAHLDQIQVTRLPESVDGCEDCLRTGDPWLHLRICLSCGHVGCCDDSPNRHATAHADSSGHALIRSIEPGEDWSWCYADRLAMSIPGIAGETRIPPSPLGG